MELSGYYGRRVLIIGAAGFIGRWIGRLLTKVGAQLILVVRDQGSARVIFSQYQVAGETIAQDLMDLPAVSGILEKIKPEITFNMAGYGIDPAERDTDAAWRINSELPATICQEIARIKSKGWDGQDLVHAGSALEYGEAHGDLDEGTLPAPSTLYGITKLKGSDNLRRYSEQLSVKSLTARLFTVYGPGELPGRLLPSLFNAAGSGEYLPLTRGDQKRDFTYVEDAAEGLVRLGLSRTQPGETINLATGRLTSVREFVEIAARELSIPFDHLRFGALPIRSEEMEHDPVSIKRLDDIIHWLPRISVAEGIRRTSQFKVKFEK